MPSTFDVAIGTVFVFLLFSMIVSAFNELLLSFFDQRAKFLHMGLQEMFGEASDPTKRKWRKGWWNRLSGGLSGGKIELGPWTQQLYDHGLINSLSRTDSAKGTSPSYIPPGAFVTALLDLISRQVPPPVAPAAPIVTGATLDQQITAAGNDPAKLLAIVQALRAAGDAQTSTNIQAWIENQRNAHKALYDSLHSLFISVNGNVDKFKAGLEGWFNATMDRVSGWYKRFAQKWMIAIGFVLAVALNVDTIHIVQELSVAPNLAKAVASQAESYARNGQPPESQEEADSAREAAKKRVVDAQEALAKAQADKEKTSSQIVKAQKDLRDATDAESAGANMRSAIARLSNTGIPIGWSERLRDLDLDGKIPFPGFRPWLSAHWTTLGVMLLGWLLTALAASLGAPFWFDTLSRFVNIRNAGRPPGETDNTSTPTKPPPASLDKPPTA